MVITELPPDQAKQALEKLCMPVVNSLQVRFITSRFIHSFFDCF